MMNTFCAFVATVLLGTSLPTTSPGGFLKTIPELRNYRSWVKVTPKPIVLPPMVAVACAANLPMNNMPDDHTDKSQKKFFLVFVNRIGRAAMMAHDGRAFPKGTIIVKEKHSSETSISPELLTVMIKHQAGYSPETGDWEYMATNGAATSVEKRGKLENCQACHVTMKDQDFVYKSYVPWRRDSVAQLPPGPMVAPH